MMKSVSAPATIALTKGSVPVCMVVQQKETWEAMCTLGIRIAPDGNYKNEYLFLKAKADNSARRLLTSRLTKTNTFIFHHSTYVPAMTYSSCITTFIPSTLNCIQQRQLLLSWKNLA
jgi:hypothetical protein